MLKNIPKIISPALLKILCEMGHGDEIVIADGNFPAEAYGQRVIRADGLGGEEMLDAVLSLIPLDTYALENFLLMKTTNGDPIPAIWDSYFAIAKKHDGNLRAGNLERFEFYERAKKAYAVIATGEGAVYANIILKKGVIK
ncbi:MAG: fucose isomerase [Clostridiales bacterium]|nr:fucose isomerase [Clostridiales bacterium]MBQ2769168.1 fucose isomerase [Clostridia bacterium]